MAGVNQFSPFGLAPGANVLTATSWQALTARQNGFSSGLANSTHCNTAWRQATVVAAMLGQFIADHDLNAMDDGDLATLQANFEAAILVLTGGSIGDVERVHTGQDTGAVNSIIANVSPDITAYGFLSYYLIRIANTNTAGVVVNLDNVGIKPLLRVDGTGLVAGDIIADSVVPMVYDGTSFRLLSFGSAEVPRILGLSTLYVATNGNDANDGLSTQKPLLTIDAALKQASNYFTFAKPLTIQLIKTGTTGVFPFPPTQTIIPGSLIIRGDPNAQGNYIIEGIGTPSGGGSVIGTGGQSVKLIGLTVRNTGTINNTLSAASKGSMEIERVTLTSTATLPNSLSHFFVSGSSSGTIGPGVRWASSAASMMSASAGDIAITTNASLFVDGNVNFSDAAASARDFGRIVARPGSSITTTGTVTGVRYRSTNAIIAVSGQGTEYFPGNQPGTSSGAGGYSP